MEKLLSLENEKKKCFSFALGLMIFGDVTTMRIILTICQKKTQNV